MANSFTLLADLKAGHAPHRRECKHISFRLTLGGFFHSDCLKFWVSPFQQLTLMQGSVSSKYHFRFRNRLTEGSVYSLSGFDVTRRNPNFRLSDAPSPYDMIGELNAIRSTITDRIPGAQCVILTLRLQSKLESCGKESKIVLATSVNPKIVGDNLDVFVDKPEYLSCGEGDFVVNDVIALLPQMKNNSLVSESTKNYERRGVWPSLYSTTVITSLRGHGADQKASSSKLNKFIVTADSQIIEFLCTARVTGILMTVGIDAKVGKTCNDASTAKRAPSSKEQVAEKSRVE
uniref:Uncharacterized protein n=1 Tax=Brassica campestris TaxID=3711 RepID=A0A3P6AZR7_BRACM|nr:unnamed protein product [Brassica rapa]